MADFPDELIDDILLRLPVKSLLRFRCVSKRWCALIDNNSFVKQHLNHSILTKSNHTLIIETYFDTYFDFHSVGLYSLTNQPLKLAPPIHSPATILGSCNGLLCLSEGLDCNIVFLWNPATRKHVKLPVIKPCAGVLRYGFGYDSASDDYKFVRVHQFTDLFSLRSNSWRIIEDIRHDLIDNEGPAALACGALHWIGYGNSDSHSGLIAAFDLATEKHMIFALPYYPRDKVLCMFVSELGGCLSFVCDNRSDCVFDVWVMKDYGASESWTKLITLSNFEIEKTIDNLIPLVYSKSGDEVLLVLDSVMVLWYNLETRTSKVVDVSEITQYFFISLESLVSLGEKAENDEK